MTLLGPRLYLDATPGHVIVARGFAVAGLQVLEIPAQLVEDAKLAVSELVTMLVVAGHRSIQIDLDPDGPRLAIMGSGPLPPLPAAVESILDAMGGTSVSTAGDTWILTVIGIDGHG